MRIFREVIGGVIFAVITTATVIGGIGLLAVIGIVARKR